MKILSSTTSIFFLNEQGHFNFLDDSVSKAGENDFINFYRKIGFAKWIDSYSVNWLLLESKQILA